jgi:hypothetical protein
MAAPSSIVLKNYYSGFIGVRGVVAAVGTFSPLLPELKPGTWLEYLLAPLGEIDFFARVALIILCAGITYLVYFIFQGQSSKARKRTFLMLLLVAPLLSVLLYMSLCLLFVRKIDIPTLQRSVYVSVGYQRSEFAKKTFGSMTDEEMLRQRSVEEEEIQKLWTPFSILVVRLALFVSWCGFALSLISGFSLGVLDQVERRREL